MKIYQKMIDFKIFWEGFLEGFFEFLDFLNYFFGFSDFSGFSGFLFFLFQF